jgi:hypothetical protein
VSVVVLRRTVGPWSAGSPVQLVDRLDHYRVAVELTRRPGTVLEVAEADLVRLRSPRHRRPEKRLTAEGAAELTADVRRRLRRLRREHAAEALGYSGWAELVAGEFGESLR